MKIWNIGFKNNDYFKVSFLDLMRIFMKRLLKLEARDHFL